MDNDEFEKQFRHDDWLSLKALFVLKIKTPAIRLPGSFLF
jgi:hypothetical protein